MRTRKPRMRRSASARTHLIRNFGWEEENGESVGCLRGIAGSVQGVSGQNVSGRCKGHVRTMGVSK
nr:MAG TPA: hypothetical protein [Caudoviricetes sp.]